MKVERFWETFWLLFVAIALASLFASLTMFLLHINSVNAAAVGMSFDPTKDPFETATKQGNFQLIQGYVYRDTLPLGLSQWSWDADLNWTSTEQKFEGVAALKMTFNKPWAGMGVSGFSVSRNSAQTLTFAVYPDASVTDLYVELYDKNGNSMGRQSVGWYTLNGRLVPNFWQTITIPLYNLAGAAGSQTITGISISTENTGVAFVDSLQFTNTPSSHSVWVQPADFDTPPFNPFATSTPSLLPYVLTFSPEAFSHWYSYYGTLMRHDDGMVIGPTPGGNTDSVSVFRGGKSWADYQVKTTVDWGLASTFSVLTRFADAQNYVSCAFGSYGQTVTIYDVHNGVSTELAQTPALSVPYDSAWVKVPLGAQVQGKHVACFARGTQVLSADISDIPVQGSVGLEVWDQNSYASPHTVRQLEVDPMLGE
jgi:hypothetical protein